MKTKYAAIAALTVGLLSSGAFAATNPSNNAGNVANVNEAKIENSNIGAENWRATARFNTSSFDLSSNSALANTEGPANWNIDTGTNALIDTNQALANLPNIAAQGYVDTGTSLLVNDNSCLVVNAATVNAAYAIAANQDTGSSGARTLSVNNANGNLGSANNALVLVNIGSSNRSVQALE